MDWQLIQPIFHWLSDHPVWSGLFVFLIALTESLIVIGLIVPGTVLMFGVGTLVGTGVLDVKLVLFLAFLGAVLGDGISFWIGATYREQIETFWPFKKKPKILKKGKEFFIRHGGKSVFFGRFVGPVRPIIPAIAGMMHMPAKKFFFINILSAAGWAPFYLIPGILFGTSIGLASAIGSRLVIILLSLIVFIVIFIYMIKITMKFIAPRLEIWFLLLLKWTSRYQYLYLTLGELIDPNKNVKSALLKISLIFFLLVVTSSFFIFSILTPWLGDLDKLIISILGLLHTATNDYLMWLVQVVFSWPIIIIFLLSVFINLYANKHTKPLIHIGMLITASVLSAWVLVFLYSLFVDVDVHQLAFIQLVVLTTMLFFYVVISCESVKQEWHWLFYSLAALFILFFFISQLYFLILPVSLVIIALSLSLSWLLIFSLAYRRHDHVVQSFSFLSKSSIVVCLFTAMLLIQNDSSRVEFISKNNEINHNTIEDIEKNIWLTQKWQEAENYRIDIFGKNKDRLNIQWLASLDEIKNHLLASGWRVPTENTFQSILYRLAPDPDVDKFIRLPRTHNGAKESLLLIKDYSNKQQLVLQLWPTLFTVNNKPIWLGTISIQQLKPRNRWLTTFQVVEDNVHVLKNFISEKNWLTLIVEKKGQEYLLVSPSENNSVRHAGKLQKEIK